MTQEMTKEEDMFAQSTDSNVDKIFEKEDISLNEIFKIRRWVRHSRQEQDAFRGKVEGNASGAMKTETAASEREGIAKWVLNDWEEARGVLSGVKTELGHCFHALCLKEEGRAEEALEYLGNLGSEFDKSKNVAIMKLKLMYSVGVFDEDADKLVSFLEKDHADDIETVKVRGMYLECSGDPGAAVDIYKQVLAAEPADEEVLFCLAVLLDRLGEDEEALKYYEKAADVFPVRVNSVLNLGQVYYERGENEKAVFCFKRVLRQHPDHKFALRFVKDITATENMYYDEKKAKQVEELNKKLQIPVTDFELSVRSRNCLSQMNIKTLGDLIQKTEADLLSYKNFGETSLAEIKRMLSSKGLYLGMAKDMEDQELREKQKRQITDEASSEILEKSIDTLELSVRAGKCLEKLGMKTLGDILKYDEATLLKVRNFGQTSLNEIKKKLAVYNLSLKNE